MNEFRDEFPPIVRYLIAGVILLLIVISIAVSAIQGRGERIQNITVTAIVATNNRVMTQESATDAARSTSVGGTATALAEIFIDITETGLATQTSP